MDMALMDLDFCSMVPMVMEDSALDFLHSHMIYFMVLVMVAMGLVDVAAMVSMGMVVMGDMDMDMVTEDMALVVMEGMDILVPMVGIDTVMAITDMVDLVVIDVITAIFMR